MDNTIQTRSASQIVTTVRKQAIPKPVRKKAEKPDSLFLTSYMEKIIKPQASKGTINAFYAKISQVYKENAFTDTF